MVQRFPELQRINHSMAVSVFFVMPGKLLAGKHKACYLFAVFSESDGFKITAHA